MRRVLSVVVLIVALSTASTTLNAQTIDFDQYELGTPVEQLTEPGVIFDPTPDFTWYTYPASELFFVGLGGMCIFQPGGESGTLDILFSTPVSNISFSFAQNDISGTAQLKTEAYNGASLVGSVTETAKPPFEGYYGEGFVRLAPGASFNRVRISSPTGQEMAIDNIVAEGVAISVVSQPRGMLQASGSGGATDSYTVANRGSIAASVTLSKQGSFFTQSPGSFTLNPGSTQTVTLTGTAQGPGSFNGTSILNVSEGAGASVPVTLLSATPPTGDVKPVPTSNRVDVAGDVGQNPNGSVSFRNDGTSTIQAVAVSSAPWLIPQTGVITIAPGQTASVSFSIDRSLRPDGSVSYGSVFGTLSLRYLTSGTGKTTFAGTGASLVTVVDTTKPQTGAADIPPLNGQNAFFLTGVGHVTGGGGVVYISDVTLGNLVDTITLGDLSLFFSPREGGVESKQSTIPTLAPNQALSLADVVKNVYNTETVGTMQVRAPALANLSMAASIFNSSDPKGTFGTAIPVLRTDRSIKSGQKLFLPGIIQDSTHRTNFYLQETSGDAATFRTDFLSSAGNVIGTRTDAVLPFQMLQVTNPAPQGTVTAVITQTGGDGSISGYATPLDTVSGDTWAVTDWNAAFGSTSNQKALIPIAGSAPGGLGTFFRTDLQATNTGATTRTVRFTYRPSGGSEVVRDVSIKPNESFIREDVVRSLFNITDASSLGYILIDPMGGNITTTSRTYTTVSGSSATYGTAIPAIPLTETLALGQKKVFGGLEDSSLETLQAGTPATFRTNVDIVETNGAPVTVRASLLLADGRNLAGGTVASKDYPIQAGQLFRINRITDNILGAKRTEFGDIRNFQLKFEVISGSGKVAITVSSTDNGTNDTILRVQ